MIEFINAIDWSILGFIQKYFRCEFLDYVMPKITFLGNNGQVWILIGIILVITKKYRKIGITMLLAMLIGYLIGNVAIKNIVMRDRPCWIDSSVKLLIKNPLDYSFPSGHTLSSVISATVLILGCKKFSYFAIPLALLISFSRLYLYVHFPSDVLFAIVLGIVIGLVFHKISNKIKPVNKRLKVTE